MKRWHQICVRTWIVFLLPFFITGCQGQEHMGTQAETPKEEQTEKQAEMPEIPETPEIPQKTGETVTLSFITIGKGDAFLLQVPEDGAYLIDTGKKEDIVQIIRLLREKQIESLKGVFLSHGHKDHAGGLDAILTAFPTEAVYLSGQDTVSFRETRADLTAENHQVPVVKLSSGTRMELGAVQADIWCPPHVDVKEENNNSVILRLTCGDTGILMMGDAEEGEEAALLSSGFELKADVLKLGHHGKEHSTSLELLKRVSPAYGIICDNEEENPDLMDSQVQTRLAAMNVEPVFSDETLLAVDFVLDGVQVTVKPVAKDTVTEDQDSPRRAGSILIQQVDRKKQCVTLSNRGTEAANMGGWLLFSERGSEACFFPEGTVLEPGKAMTVVCQDSGEANRADLVWNEDSVWSKKKDDAACLYDRDMHLIDKKD